MYFYKTFHKGFLQSSNVKRFSDFQTSRVILTLRSYTSHSLFFPKIYHTCPLMITNRKGNVKTIYQLNAEDKCLTIKTMFVWTKSILKDDYLT